MFQKRFFGVIVVLAFVATSALAQAPAWRDRVKAFYANCNCSQPDRTTGRPTSRKAHPSDTTPTTSAPQAAPTQLVSISTNTGRFANPGAPVQVRVDIDASYSGPANVFGSFQMRQAGQPYHMIDYFIPEGTLYGHYDSLTPTGFIAVNVAMPTSFGDQMLFDVIVTDPSGNMLDQQYTEVTVGGVADGMENYFHLDRVYPLGNGLVGMTGRFPTGTQIGIKFGDNRTNASGLVFAQALDDQNLVLPFNFGMGVFYSFAMDATVCFFHECYTVPNGLVFNGPNITPQQ